MAGSFLESATGAECDRFDDHQNCVSQAVADDESGRSSLDPDGRIVPLHADILTFARVPDRSDVANAIMDLVRLLNLPKRTVQRGSR